MELTAKANVGTSLTQAAKCLQISIEEIMVSQQSTDLLIENTLRRQSKTNSSFVSTWKKAESIRLNQIKAKTNTWPFKSWSRAAQVIYRE